MAPKVKAHTTGAARDAVRDAAPSAMQAADAATNAEYLITGAAPGAELATMADFQSGRMLGGNVESAVPKEWADRAKKAWEYFVEEPLVKSGINCWLAFSIGSGPEIGTTKEEEKVAADAEAERLGVAQFVEDMCLQLLTKGTCIGYRRMDAKDKTRVAEIQCVNPVSCKLTYEDGQLTKCVQTPDKTDKKGGKPIELPPDQLFVRHWDAPKFAGSGNSMVVPAFEPIELLREYRRAERAIARRWTTPLRLIQVGGQFGTKTIIPTQQDLNKVRDLINKMDLKSGLVVPFYVKVETYGAEGQVLRVEQKVANAKEDIMIAMGLAKTLITGDGPNFATAQIALKKMATQIKKLAKMAREICAWVMDDWALREGMGGLTYSVDYLDPTDEIDYIKILIEMYDKGLVSKATVQKAMDLNPEKEKGSIDEEANNARDGRVTGPLCNMVNSGVITPNEARKLLGLEPLKPSAAETAPSSGAAWMGDYANMTAHAGETCAGCASREGGQCAVMGIPREDTDQACRFRP